MIFCFLQKQKLFIKSLGTLFNKLIATSEKTAQAFSKEGAKKSLSKINRLTFGSKKYSPKERI
jgi:hypothetical protein